VSMNREPLRAGKPGVDARRDYASCVVSENIGPKVLRLILASPLPLFWLRSQRCLSASVLVPGVFPGGQITMFAL